MQVGLMRLVWAAMQAPPSPVRLRFSPGERINAAVREIERRTLLSPQERQQVQQYLYAHTQLIEDLYQEQTM